MQADGKIGAGTGLVMHRDSAGKTRIESCDEDFVEALAYIGIEVVDKKKTRR